MTRATQNKSELSGELTRLTEARHHDPFNVLGKHVDGKQATIRVYLPHTKSVRLVNIDESLTRLGQSDFFEWCGKASKVDGYYQLSRQDNHN